jgi:hypothetical protein
MFKFARAQVGKPFSNVAMVRSIIYPRQTTGEDFFCAELVAAVLQVGGLLSASANPGAATPESLHALYSRRGAATANPYLLQHVAAQRLSTTSLRSNPSTASPTAVAAARQRSAEEAAMLIERAVLDARGAKRVGGLHVVAGRRVQPESAMAACGGITLSLASLDMRKVTHR